jgi:hypothetical protein
MVLKKNGVVADVAIPNSLQDLRPNLCMVFGI